MSVKSTHTRKPDRGSMARAEQAMIALSLLRDFKPLRDEYSPDAVTKMATRLEDSSRAEQAALIAYNNAHDAAVKAQWDCYEFALGAAEQVAAQYGSSSDEFASLGYKRKSEYKKAKRGGKDAV